MTSQATSNVKDDGVSPFLASGSTPYSVRKERNRRLNKRWVEALEQPERMATLVCATANVYRTRLERIARRLGYYPDGVTMVAARCAVMWWPKSHQPERFAVYTALAMAARAADCVSRGHTP